MAEYDVVIKGGTVIDGTRMPRFRADVGIKDGRVARIGRLSASDGETVLDAAGMIVAPGFVDLHTHYDAQVFWDPYCTLSGWHGITSLVIGNCGFGFAPVATADRDRAMMSMTRVEAIPLPSMQAGMPWDWETFPEFLDSLQRTPKAVNLLPYMPVSHCSSGSSAMTTPRPAGARPRPSTARSAACSTRPWMPERAAGPRSACLPPVRPRCSATSTARRWSAT